MRTRRFEWGGAEASAAAIRAWVEEAAEPVDVAPIERDVIELGDEIVLSLTARLDAPENPPQSLRVNPALARAALEALEPELRAALDLASVNVRAVAELQLGEHERRLELLQGQRVKVREVPLGATGIYAPGGRAAYPSSVLMCAIPAQVAGIERIALASPPGPDGNLHPLVLAVAALCGIEEIYSMGGAQAIFALAHGTETV